MTEDTVIASHASDQIWAATHKIKLGNAAFTSADEGLYIRITGSAQGNNNDYLIDVVLNGTEVIVRQRPAADETTGFMTASVDGLYLDDVTPAKRRKMANVVMNTWLKYHIFYVYFDALAEDLLDAEFLQDLRELILVAKPGYKFIYIEPASAFLDTMKMTEDALLVDIGVPFSDSVVMEEDELTIQSMSWKIGDVWRQAAITTGHALSVADGVGIPSPTNLGVTNLIAARVKNVPFPYVEEYKDYELNYKTGVLTPTTIWPACSPTLDYSRVVLTAQASKDASLGDTDYVIGGHDPERVRSRKPLSVGSIVTDRGGKILRDPDAEFVASLHTGHYVTINDTAAAGRWRIESVASATEVRLANPDLPDVSTCIWGFPSEEPSDGDLSQSGSDWHFVSKSAMFKAYHVGRYIQIVDAGNSANDGFHRILTVESMSEVTLQNPSPTFVAESDLHWRIEGSGAQMDIVERPVEIRIY